MEFYSSNIERTSCVIKRKNIFTPTIPIVLVHGWRSSPDVWSKLIYSLSGARLAVNSKTHKWEFASLSLEESGIFPYSVDDIWIFDYSDYSTEDPKFISQQLKSFIEKKREETGYDNGKIDIICHSMGALVSRYYMEVLTNLSGDKNAKTVSQWIGICPANHGAALANLSGIIPLCLKTVIPTFIGFSPSVIEMRTYSEIVRAINRDPICPGVKYRVVVGYNSDQSFRFKAFSSIFGKTIEVIFDELGNRRYNLTYFGDGVLSLAQSYLEGAGLDCFGMEDHSSAPRSKQVIEIIQKYLQNPDIPVTVNWPQQKSGKVSFNPNDFLKSMSNKDG